MPKTKVIRQFTDERGRTLDLTFDDRREGVVDVKVTEPARGHGVSETPAVDVGFELTRASAMDLVILLGPLIDRSVGRTTVLAQGEASLMAEVIALRTKLDELRAEVERHVPTWKAHT